MALIRPRLTDHHGISAAQESLDFAIPFLDEDLPLYVDPFLLWKSPSQQDQALHTSVVASFNHFGSLAKRGRSTEAVDILVEISECREVGLGHARNKVGHRIGRSAAEDILSIFTSIPQIERGGLDHIEEVQLLVDGISRDRISDFTCNLVKSFLVDYTIDQCTTLGIPLAGVELPSLFDLRKKTLVSEKVMLPTDPLTGSPILLVPKRWLRFSPWINYEDYFANSFVKEGGAPEDLGRAEILNYNRQNYDLITTYVAAKERTREECHNDPLFKPIPALFAKRRLAELKKIPTGNAEMADKKYEAVAAQLLSSMLYPQLDFAAVQSRTDGGVLVRDLIFYNTTSSDFLRDIRDTYGSRQLVMELKNVAKVEREHVNQLNRYLNDTLGRFGVIVTRHPLPSAIVRNTIALWSGQRRCIVALTDADLELMVTVFESRQRDPIDVLKKKYADFHRAGPS